MDPSSSLNQRKSPENLFRTRFKRLLADKFNHDLSQNTISKQENVVPAKVNPTWSSYTPTVQTQMFELIESDDGKAQIQPERKKIRLSNDSVKKLNDSKERTPLSKIYPANRNSTNRLPFFLRKQQFKTNRDSVDSNINSFAHQNRVRKNKIQRIIEPTNDSLQLLQNFSIIEKSRKKESINNGLQSNFKFSDPQILSFLLNGETRNSNNHAKVFSFSDLKNICILDEFNEKTATFNIEDEIIESRDPPFSVIDQLRNCPVCRHFCDNGQIQCSLCKHRLSPKKSSFIFSKPDSFDLTESSSQLQCIDPVIPTKKFKFSEPSTDLNRNDEMNSSKIIKHQIKVKSIFNDSNSDDEFQYFNSGALLKFRKLFYDKQIRLKKKEERDSKLLKTNESLQEQQSTHEKSSVSVASPGIKKDLFNSDVNHSVDKIFNPSIPFSNSKDAKNVSAENLFTFNIPLPKPETNIDSKPVDDIKRDGNIVSNEIIPNGKSTNSESEGEPAPKKNLFKFATDNSSSFFKPPKTELFQSKADENLFKKPEQPVKPNPFVFKSKITFGKEEVKNDENKSDNVKTDEKNVEDKKDLDNEKSKNIFAVPSIFDSQSSTSDFAKKDDKSIFSFGLNQNKNSFSSTSTSTVPPFGSSTKPQESGKPGFTFGNIKTDVSSIFDFGSKPTTSTATPGNNPVTTAPSSGFQFGNVNTNLSSVFTFGAKPSTTAATTAPNIPPATISSTMFQFGNAKPDVSSVFAFNPKSSKTINSSATTPAVSGFQFEANKPINFNFSSLSSSIQSPTLPSPVPMTTFGFRSQTPKIHKPEKVTGYSFNNPKPDAPPIFSFGAKTTINNPTTTASSSGFQFGNANTNLSSVFTFGTNSSIAPAAAPTSTNINSATTATPSGLGFGNPNSNPNPNPNSNPLGFNSTQLPQGRKVIRALRRHNA